MPEWLYKYENVFSKNKSERMPIWKLYNHAIDFIEDTTLSNVMSWLQRRKISPIHLST